MKVMVSGASGLIGSALSENLKGDAHTVIALPRTYEDPIDFSVRCFQYCNGQLKLSSLGS